MFNIFAVISLLFFIISSYYFNNSKLTDTKLHIFFISLLDAVLCYLIVILLFLQGFLSIFFILVLLILLIPLLGIIIFSIEREYGIDDELQIETVKNNLILFVLTILPLYVFLTIFRYQPFFFQIPLAVSLTVLLLFSSKKVYKLTSPTYEKVVTYITSLGAIKYFYLWLTIGIIVVLNILFQLPTNIVSDSLNLSNNAKYLSFDGFPTTINNNFQQKEIMQIKSDYLIESEITDYYYNDTHLFVYTKYNLLLVFNLSTKDIIYEIVLETGETHEESNSVYASTLYSKFIYYDGYLILLGKHDTYLVTTDSAIKISDISSYYAKYYYLDNKLYFLNRNSETIFEIHKFEDGVISLSTIINLETTTHDNLLVISDNYFYEENDKYILNEDPSISFAIKEGSPLYDADNLVMYYVTKNYAKTVYQKEAINNETLTISLKKNHNSIGIIVDNNIYYTEEIKTIKSRVEIINSDFEIDAIFNHLELQPFWIGNNYKFYGTTNENSYISNYQEQDNNLEFLQVDKNNNYFILTIYQIEEKDIDLNLPFYTHYGIEILIPIIIIFFFPITNYRSSIGEISFLSKIKKGKK